MRQGGADQHLRSLDDYHLAEGAEVNDFVMLLLENLPVMAHLVLITGIDPALRLARLRGQGELVEIRECDPAFHVEEIGAFLAGGERDFPGPR